LNRSYLIAAALALGITAWMLAGYLVTEPANEAASVSQPSVKPPELMTVEVRLQKARQVARHIVAQGQVEPNRTVTVRAETAGKIAEVVAEEGRAVQAGDVLVRIELADRQVRLNKAEALVREWQRAHEGADRLGEKGYQSQRLIDETYSELQSAQAALEEIRLEISNTAIRAPFDGILEARRVELGDYVAVNGEIATIVDNDPLVVAVQIAQQAIEDIALGDAATVAFATGQEGEGPVRYVAPRAEEATRTFRVEIAVPNPDSRIPSGTSAEARLPTGTVLAHFVSPGLLSLNDSGVLGVKTVDETDSVAFHPVTIVLAESSGIWVSGLPDDARIITVGQGFVRDGETVRVVPAEDSGVASDRAGGTVGMLSQVAPRLSGRPR
jgi:multidrug efflux system membrane fusion protein